MIRNALPGLFTIALAISAAAQYPPASMAKDPLFAGVPVGMTVPAPPVRFEGSDLKFHLVYEVHVTNFSNAALLLTKIEAIDDVSGRTIAGWSGDELKGRLRPLPGKSEDPLLAGGMTTVVFIWLDFDTHDTPDKLRHRLSVTVPDFPQYGTRSVDGAPVGVAGDARVIGPPLRGGDWWAANGPADGSHHRRTLLAESGEARIPQRYATDWARQKDGELLKGDASENSSYFGYGSEVLAVADGTVVSMLDGVPDNRGDAETRAVPITRENIAGNSLIIDIGQHQFAMYAHLQPQSIRVKVGERVTRGQLLALVGNSGNSTGPHLHFQLSDRNSALGTEGLPFVIDGFTLIGRVSGEKPALLPQQKSLARVMPLDDDLVRFGP